MIGFDLKLHGDGAFEDLRGQEHRVIHIADQMIGLATLEGGMQSGMPSCMLRIDLPDGRVVLFETSARAFVTAAKAIEARYPGLLD